MAWFDQLQSGSFRNVPFFIQDSTRGGGRRNVKHEFPDRNNSRTEDLGRRIRGFSVDFVIIGNGSSYFAQRDRMLDALEQDGSGILIHPYWGQQRVTVDDFSIRESVQDGGIATFSVSFSESGQNQFPEATTDNVTTTINQADTTIASSTDAFTDKFSVFAKPAFVADKAASNVRSVSDFLSNQVNKFVQPIDSVTKSINNLNDDVEALIQTPETLATRIQGTFDDLFNALEGDPDSSRKIFREFNDLEDDFEEIPGQSEFNQDQRDNQDAMIALARQAALSNQAKSAVNVTYTSTAGAIEARGFVIDEIEAQLATATNDELINGLQDLQSNLVKALPSTNLADLITFVPSETTPAILIAYEIFKSLDKEDEILDQNNILHPAFVPGGIGVEVSGG